MSNVIKSVVNIIKLRWSVDILRALAKEPLRYTDLQLVITVSTGRTVYNRSFTEALRRLEDGRLIEHHIGPEGTAFYGLTQVGAELISLLDGLERWGARHPALC
ncbi:winged helix-turn-helix transcriptional regulator [Actinoplanes sp. NPDC049596]|uniref:winged helix-turn-helix transcriptional regulator n=1 Tax=unclassified Actinoplanes TaxID=2626549 RepID=UPI00341B757B